MRRRSGRIAAPPGPRKRSRDEMLSGRCQRIGVPVSASFFFLDLARPVSIEVRLSISANSKRVRIILVVFINFLRDSELTRGAARGIVRELEHLLGVRCLGTALVLASKILTKAVPRHRTPRRP